MGPYTAQQQPGGLARSRLGNQQPLNDIQRRLNFNQNSQAQVGGGALPNNYSPGRQFANHSPGR